MKYILAVIMTLFFVINPFSVYASNQTEIYQRVESDIQVANDLLDAVEAVGDDGDAILSVFKQRIPSTIRHWNESSRFYEAAVASETDTDIKTVLMNINKDIRGLSSSLAAIQDSIEAGDPDAYTTALDRYDSNISSLNSHLTALDGAFGAVDYSWLAWPFWISLVISVTLFIMSRGNPILPAEQLRNQFEFALFKSSLWPLGGSTVSYIWYLFTPPGGTFTVFWGVIAVGYFQFARGLYTYLTQARPAINLAKKEEKSKLDALIRSDKFQKESMEEKIREIEKRSGVIDLTGK